MLWDTATNNLEVFFVTVGRDELITQHALAWNQRKICATLQNDLNGHFFVIQCISYGDMEFENKHL